MKHSYCIPENLRVYAIGDIHGYAAHLDKMHEAIAADLLEHIPPEGMSAHIVYIGDYIDRGPDSAGVIERLIERKARGDGITKTFLKGNHEQGLISFMKQPVGHDWLNFGGKETVESYGFVFDDETLLPGELEDLAREMRATIPPAHLAFLEGLELSKQIGDYMFVHAGVHPEAALDQQEPHHLMTIRQPFLDYYKQPDFKPLECMIVHGHSSSREPVIRPHRIGVDTGVYQSGILSCAVLEGADVRFLKAEDAV